MTGQEEKYLWLFGVITSLQVVGLAVYLFFFKKAPLSPRSTEKEKEIQRKVEEEEIEITEEVETKKEEALKEHQENISRTEDAQVERAKEIGDDVQKVNDFLKDVCKDIRGE